MSKFILKNGDAICVSGLGISLMAVVPALIFSEVSEIGEKICEGIIGLGFVVFVTSLIALSILEHRNSKKS